MIAIRKPMPRGAKPYVMIAPVIWMLGSAALAVPQASAAMQPDIDTARTPAMRAAKADARPIEDLQAAAQRLRNAVHQIVREPATAKREALIENADKTLAEAEAAMANLPPDLLIAGATESRYTAASDELAKAAQDFQEATRALAKDPNSTRRDEAMTKIRAALAQTRHLLNEIPRGTARG